MFGPILAGLGAASSLVGAISGAKSAGDASKAARQQARLEAEFNRAKLGMARDAYAREDEYLDYLLGLNTDFAEDWDEYRSYSRQWADADLNERKLARDYAHDRIGWGDHLSSNERQRQIEQQQLNQQLLNQQYERAMQELAYSRAMAGGERSFDQSRLAHEQWMADQERAFQERELAGLQSQLQSERDFDVSRQEYIAGLAEQLGVNLTNELSNLGRLSAPEYLDETDFRRSQQMFMDQYGSAADRAADRIASVNESQLINAGMDTSTTGDVSRRNLLEQQVKPLYDEMIAKATQDALGYITGMNQDRRSGYESRLAGREQALAEVSSAYSPQLQAMLSLRAPESAATTAWQNVGSAIQNRDLVSAGNYRAPIAPQSRAQSIQNLNLGMIDQLSNPVATYGASPSTVAPLTSSAYFNPMRNMSTASNFLGGMEGPNSGTLSSQAASGWGAAGENFGDFLGRADGLLNRTQGGGGWMSQYPSGGPNWSWVS